MKSRIIFTILAGIFLVLIANSCRAQEVHLGPAYKLASFVKANADSTTHEADASTYELWFPEKGLMVLVSWINKEFKTLEIYNFSVSVTSFWCLNFSCQNGNIYDGLYAIKFLPESATKKVTQFDQMIGGLNTVTTTTLATQRADQKKLQTELVNWAAKKRTWDEYEIIYELPIWKQVSNLSIDFLDDNVLGTDEKSSLRVESWLGPVPNPVLRKVIAAVKGK